MTTGLAILAVVALLCCGVFSVEYLPDPSFENPTVSTNWGSYGSGFQVSTGIRLAGLKSIYAVSTTTTGSYGAYKQVSNTAGGAVRMSGYSRSNTTVSGSTDSDYAIYADVAYTDGTNQWGVSAQFTAGAAHDWQFSCETLVTDKTISSLNIYPMFRSHSGTVYFDLFSVASYTLPTVVTSSTNPLKILVPLYIYPGASWTTVRNSASDVPITVIANPNSGPGTSRDNAYATYINSFVHGSPVVPVLGYVHTEYGERDLNTVKGEILSWKNFYNISGIFLDEASDSLDDLSYYSSLNSYIKATFGANAQVFLNPGTSTPENYTAISESVMFFESDITAFNTPQYQTTLPAGWPRAPCYSSYTNAWKYKSNAVVYNVNSASYQSVVDKLISKGFGYVFVTDATLPNPYGALPSYWSNLVNYIKGKNV